MMIPRVEPKTFAQRAKMIDLARTKKRENEELFHKLQNSVTGQEILLSKLKENEKLIKDGEQELEVLIAVHFTKVNKMVYQYTTDVAKRTQFLAEGKKRIRRFLCEYDYSEATHFYDDLQGVLADFFDFMERRGKAI